MSFGFLAVGACLYVAASLYSASRSKCCHRSVLINRVSNWIKPEGAGNLLLHRYSSLIRSSTIGNEHSTSQDERVAPSFCYTQMWRYLNNMYRFPQKSVYDSVFHLTTFFALFWYSYPAVPSVHFFVPNFSRPYDTNALHDLNQFISMRKCCSHRIPLYLGTIRNDTIDPPPPPLVTWECFSGQANGIWGARRFH